MASGDVAAPARMRADLRRYQYGAALLALLALALGGLLLPRGDELLLIHVRNHDIARARAMLADASRQEVTTTASVVAHNELHLMEGRVDEALATLESYAAANPSNVPAWRRLAGMYADAQRLDDEVKALARVYELEPSADLARTLGRLYRWTGDETAECALLLDLVSSGEATADEHVRGARLAAALGDGDGALDALERFRRSQPGAIDYPALELYASLLVEHKGLAALGPMIEPLPVVQADPEVLLLLARALSSWGRPDAAVALFDRPPGVEVPPDRLALQARVAIGTSEAHATARKLAGRQSITSEALAAVVDLLLSVSDYETLTTVLARASRPVDALLVGRAIGHAASAGATGVAIDLIARFGDAGLADWPMLGLALSMERGDEEAARRWIVAIDRGSPTAEESAAVAQAEVRLGRHEQAFVRLAALAPSRETPAWALTDLANAAVAVGRVDEALTTLAASAAPTAGYAWSTLTARAGEADDITRWLASPAGRAAEPGTLRDVYYLLADRGHSDVAIAVAEQLFAQNRTAGSGRLLGEALLAANRPVEALAPLKLASATVAEARRAYEAALVGALQAGASVHAEAVTALSRGLGESSPSSDRRALIVEGLWIAGERSAIHEHVLALAAADLPRWLSVLVETAGSTDDGGRAMALVAASLDEDSSAAPAAAAARWRSDRVQALMALGAPDAVLLPHLRRQAEDVGGSWVFAYDERLAAAGLRAEQVSLWSMVGRSAASGVELRRGAAARLVELDAVAPATAVLADLADDAGPADPDVVQLVALWGAVADAHARAWLLARLQRASPADQPAWIAHLLQTGGASLVVAAMPGLPRGATPALVDAWLAAHATSMDRAHLAGALQQILLQPSPSTRDLRAAARTALAHELPGLAADAYTLVVARDPSDGEALRWLGALAFYDGRTRTARAWLERYVAGGGGEPESLYQLGEIARSDGDLSRARGFFDRARAALDARAQGDVDQALLANTLVRLEDRAAARAVFDRLLAEAPARDHVRADYGAALLAWGEVGAARAVLDLAPTPADATDASRASGRRRLDLLRTQALTESGRYAEALRVLEALETRVPTDPDVLVTRAGFDHVRGRAAAADRAVARAVEAAPQREDIERQLIARAQQRSPRAGIETERRVITGGWEEQYVRASAQTGPIADAPVAVTLERLRLSARQVRGAQGSVAPLETELSRFDASATWRVGADTLVGGAVFGTGRGVGAGVRLTRDDLRGRSELLGEAGRPFWEFLETAADDGRRDRIAVQRQWRFRPDTAAWIYGGWHRYRVAAGAHTDSAALTLGVVHTVRGARPSLALQYGLDKEQRLGATLVATSDGSVFMPIPLMSREVHLLGAVVRTGLEAGWQFEGAGGYTVDRLGGRGGFFTARLTPPPAARTGVELWAEHRLFVLATSQRVFRAGARLKVRF